MKQKIHFFVEIESGRKALQNQRFSHTPDRNVPFSPWSDYSTPRHLIPNNQHKQRKSPQNNQTNYDDMQIKHWPTLKNRSNTPKTANRSIYWRDNQAATTTTNR